MSQSELDVASPVHSPPISRQRRAISKNNRTLRACDRCRFKKSKCDGRQPCKSCTTSDRTCVYSLRRRRDARNWYCGMQEAVEEAIQRLYNACKTSGSFPGTLPLEEYGRASTEEILTALGLFVAPLPNGETAADLARSGGRPQLYEEQEQSETNQDDSESETSDDVEAECKHPPSTQTTTELEPWTNTESLSDCNRFAKPCLQQQMSSDSCDSSNMAYFMHGQRASPAPSSYSHDTTPAAWPYHIHVPNTNTMTTNDFYCHDVSDFVHTFGVDHHLSFDRSQLSDFERRMMLVDD